MDQPVGEVDPLAPRQQVHKIRFDPTDVIVRGQTKALGNASDVSVDDDTLGDSKPGAQHDVGSLPSNARKREEFVHG
jgi:hypothetical protein